MLVRGTVLLRCAQNYAYWSKKKTTEASRKQRWLCYSAVQCLKPGDSTCTFAPEENEAIINRVLRQFASVLTVEDIALPFGRLSHRYG